MFKSTLFSPLQSPISKMVEEPKYVYYNHLILRKVSSLAYKKFSSPFLFLKHLLKNLSIQSRREMTELVGSAGED